MSPLNSPPPPPPPPLLAKPLNINPLSPQNLIKVGLSPSLRSLNFLLSSLLKSRKRRLLLHLFSQLASNSVGPNPRTHTLVACALLRSRRFDEAAEHLIAGGARESFSSAPKSSILDSLIRGVCVFEGNPEKALSLLIDIGVKPSRRTLRSLVSRFCSQGRMERAVEVLETVLSGKDGNLVDNYLCSLIVAGFSRIGKPELGLDFFYRLQKACAFQPNLVTWTSVVDALCQAGRVHEASDLVGKMEEDGLIPDAVLYSCWIRGCFKEGSLMEGLRKHKRMAEIGISPDVFNYTNVIDGLCKQYGVEKVIGFLNEMESKGVKPNLVTYTAVIHGFCKRNKLDEAISVFRRVEELGLLADEFIYAVIIDGLCRKGDLDRVFSLLGEMEKREIKVGNVTYNILINGLCKAGKVGKADEISRSFVGDNFTYCTLIHGYVKEIDLIGALQMKRRLDEAGFSMDLATCNVLLKAFFMAGLVDDGLQMFREMPNMGLVANFVTYCTIIDGCCKLGFIEKALKLFDEYGRSSTFSSAAIHNCIIKGLCKEGMTDMATNVFEDIMKKNLVPDSATFRILIRALYKEGDEEEILKLIQRMEKSEPELLSSICNDAVAFLCTRGCYTSALHVYMLLRRRSLVFTSNSYYVLLKGFIRNGDKRIMELIISECIKAYGTFEPKILNALFLYLCKKNVEEAINFLSTYCNRSISLGSLTAVTNSLNKEGRVDDAYKVLMEAEEKSYPVDVVTYSLVVDGLCKEGYLVKALDLCVRMRRKGIKPNIVTYNSVITGLCQQGCLTEAFRLFNFLEHHVEAPNIATYSSLIGALSREGFLDDASDLFKKMVIKGITPNILVYNKLINGYCNSGLVEEAMLLLSDLEKGMLAPDAFTVASVIDGYCQRGDIEGALGFFSEYRNRGYLPDFLGFMNLVKRLFSKGRMEEARSILRDMLQCSEVVNLIDSVGHEFHGESLISLMSLACEEGRIEEVILILNDFGYLRFSSRRFDSESRFRKPKNLLHQGSLDAEIQMIDVTGVINPLVAEVPGNESDASKPVSLTAEIHNVNDKMMKTEEDSNTGNCDHLKGEILRCGFDAYYSTVVSLCSKGDLQKANNEVKAMLQNPAKLLHEPFTTH